MAQRAVKSSCACFSVSRVGFHGLVVRRARLGIARLRTVRATSFSTEEGSSVALKPRRIKTTPQATARTPTSKMIAPSIFQGLMRQGHMGRLELEPKGGVRPREIN